MAIRDERENVAGAEGLPVHRDFANPSPAIAIDRTVGIIAFAPIVSLELAVLGLIVGQNVAAVKFATHHVAVVLAKDSEFTRKPIADFR